jgi:hypothetical protein
MPVFRDRVKDTSTSIGTSNFTLSGTAPTGYQTFLTAFGLGTKFLYCIVDNTSGLWETGTGYLSAATTFVRDTAVMDGSSGPGVLVNFTAGTKDVFCTVTSHWLEDADNGAMLHKIRGMDMP